MTAGLIVMTGLLLSVQSPDQQEALSSSIIGTATTQSGTVVLPGVRLVLTRTGAEPAIASTVSDDTGRFRFRNLPPGSYQISASLPGFRSLLQEAALEPGDQFEIHLELDLADIEEHVEVVAQKEGQIPQTGTSQTIFKGELADIAPVKGDNIGALLPLVPGVLRAADGRIVMKGGRPTQSSLVVNSSVDVTDPATGDLGFNLPSAAIESIEVLPNPYSAEYGRFSSGVTNVLTRQGTNKWKFAINNFIPRPKFRDGAIMGIGKFTPRLSFGGPLVKDRLFLAQTVQYRMITTRIPDQPPLEADQLLESFDSFTQLDFKLSQKHELTAIVSVFPRKLGFANLDTFNPQEVTANLHQRGHNIGLTERVTLTPQIILESTLSFKRYDVDVFGQGLNDMELLPDANQGHFFNTQRRKTKTWQWVENISIHRNEWAGEHLFKFGLDLLHSSYDGGSESRPVNIRRADGTLSQRIEFSDPTSQRVSSTDFALFGGDRWRLSDRLLLELGLRLDRDGVLEKTNLAPRLGLVLSILPDGRGILRGGAGLFYDRTTLNVGAFESFESRVVASFADDGVTPTGPPETFTLRASPSLQTPYSFTWNIEYDQHFGSRLLFKSNYLRRNGFHEFLIDPVQEPTSLLRLDSRGRSRYWELELTARYSLNEQDHLTFTYLRSRAEQDLNDFDHFWGSFRDPVIRPNEFSLSNTDSPNRFLLRGTIILPGLPGGWRFSPILEVRDGFPYSLVNQDREFIGERNRGGRFPHLTTLDIDIQRPFKIWRWKTRLGLRVFNLFNRFNPRDVQNNIDASLFGIFSNQITRQFGGTLQVEF